MVYYQGRKYACEACVKGHRSSSCSHSDRPLFEIKKKGRPITQCQHCRQLRKTKQVHVKCSCEGAATDSDERDTHGKAKRKIPTSPAFPHGIKDVSAPSRPSDQKARSSSSCGYGGKCTCATPVSKPRASSSSASSAPATPPPASSRCSGKSKAIPSPHPEVPPLSDFVRISAPRPQAFYDVSTPSPHAGDLASPPTSEYTWPPSIGFDKCSCGIECTCPGCVEHANPSSSLSLESCPYACSTCSNCNGFGFIPASSSIPPHDPSWIDFQTSWASTASAAPMSSLPPLASSDRCGGACKCEAACRCPDGCCGCCFGCACSDSDGGDPDPLDHIRPRLGFAVSGERASCPEDVRGGCDMTADTHGLKAKQHDDGVDIIEANRTGPVLDFVHAGPLE